MVFHTCSRWLQLNSSHTNSDKKEKCKYGLLGFTRSTAALYDYLTCQKTFLSTYTKLNTGLKYWAGYQVKLKRQNQLFCGLSLNYYKEMTRTDSLFTDLLSIHSLVFCNCFIIQHNPVSSHGARTRLGWNTRPLQGNIWGLGAIYTKMLIGERWVETREPRANPLWHIENMREKDQRNRTGTMELWRRKPYPLHYNVTI